MQTPTITARVSTPADRLADRYLDDLAVLDPVEASFLGLLGHDDRLTDYSPEGHAARAELQRRTLAALTGVAPQDAVDRVTIAAIAERLQLHLELHEVGLLLADINNVSCPIQQVREVFDIVPTSTSEDWERIATRLSAVPECLAGYRRSLAAARAAGRIPARRQVLAAAAQAGEFGEPGGFFAALPASADALPAALGAHLGGSARAAAQAYIDLAEWLEDDLLPDTGPDASVGPEIYPLWSRYFLGLAVDPIETYEWGLAELADIESRMAEMARDILPAASGPGAVSAAMDALDADPARWVEGAEEFRAWMQGVADRAVTELAGSHFDIPLPVRELTCRIAPSTSGTIYYTGPSEDFSRPGQMWWAVPKGVTRFSTWRETSTVYHEGVPGHHLQIAQTTYRKDRLNRWRRLGSWVSGHGEGWALYAERLMSELGYLTDPGDRLGQLDAAALRAARVVIDIGFHCRLEAPDEVGGGRWDPDKVWTYLRAHTRVPEANLRFEWERYLGWPGQASAYKVGERVWLDLRDRVRAVRGAGFDLRAFHREALDLGSVGLGVLRDAILADALP
jgi:uncharacterized protein (DUF885 family)